MNPKNLCKLACRKKNFVFCPAKKLYDQLIADGDPLQDLLKKFWSISNSKKVLAVSVLALYWNREKHHFSTYSVLAQRPTVGSKNGFVRSKGNKICRSSRFFRFSIRPPVLAPDRCAFSNFSGAFFWIPNLGCFHPPKWQILFMGRKRICTL